MNELRLVGNHYAVFREGRLIGTVEETGTKGWGFYPLDGDPQCEWMQLRYALADARKYEPQ